VIPVRARVLVRYLSGLGRGGRGIPKELTLDRLVAPASTGRMAPSAPRPLPLRRAVPPAMAPHVEDPWRRTMRGLESHVAEANLVGRPLNTLCGTMQRQVRIGASTDGIHVAEDLA
jgi:hypothetical protein